MFLQKVKAVRTASKRQ